MSNKKYILSTLSSVLDMLEDTESLLFSIKQDRGQIGALINEGISLMSLVVSYEEGLPVGLPVAMYIIMSAQFMQETSLRVTNPIAIEERMIQNLKERIAN